MLCYADEVALKSDDLASLKLGDEQLNLAVLECKNSRSMLPIIKEELRCKIQNRRLTEGQEELKVMFEEPKCCEVSQVYMSCFLFLHGETCVKIWRGAS